MTPIRKANSLVCRKVEVRLNDGAFRYSQSWSLLTLPCPLASLWSVPELEALLSTGPAGGKTTLVFQLPVGAEFWFWPWCHHPSLPKDVITDTHFSSGNELFPLQIERGKLDRELKSIQASPNSKVYEPLLPSAIWGSVWCLPHLLSKLRRHVPAGGYFSSHTDLAMIKMFEDYCVLTWQYTIKHQMLSIQN